MTHESRQVMETHGRQRRAYRIMVALAVDAGYMAHTRDTAGFQRMCDALEAGTVRIELRNTDEVTE